MKNIKTVITLIQKELRSFVDSPSSYVVVLTFVGFWMYLFLRGAFQVNEANLTDLFYLFIWMSLLLIPSLTMGSFSKERDEGTLELLLSHPVNEWHIILAKIVSALKIVVFILLISIVPAITFSKFASFDWLLFISQLLIMFLFSFAMVSPGVFLSSCFKSQIAALISTAIAMLVIMLFGSDVVSSALPQSVGSFFERLSALSHVDGGLRGVIDLFDVLYFILFGGTFGILTYFQLLKNKSGLFEKKFILYQLVTFFAIVSIFGFFALGVLFPVRLDLTRSKAYSLSQKTDSILANLQNDLTIKVYISKDLPLEYKPVIREVKYTLSDFVSSSRGKIKLEYIDPSRDPVIAQEAEQAGIQKVDFSLRSDQKLQINSGYFGLVMFYNGKSDALPFLGDASNLEYNLTLLVRDLSRESKNVIGYFTSHGEPDLKQGYSILSKDLARSFTLENISLTEDSPEIPEYVTGIVILQPLMNFQDYEIASLKNFLSRGGNILFIYEPYSVTSSFSAFQNNSNITSLLSDLGVSISNDVIFDMKNSTDISLMYGNNPVAVTYPFFPSLNPISTGDFNMLYVRDIKFFWPSSINVDFQKLSSQKYDFKVLFETSDRSGVIPNPSDLRPANSYPATDLNKKYVAIELVPTQDNKSGKITVFSDADIFADYSFQIAPNNYPLGLSVFSWVGGDDSLVDIKSKNSLFSIMKFDNSVQQSYTKYVILLLSILIPLIFGLYRFLLRKSISFDKYSKEKI